MTPELFTSAWFSALGAIILIDLVLAGDNALVIGLAARNVPPEMQRKVVLWGTFGAIAIRAVLTAVVVYLLKIPGFLVIGGIALIYIGWRLTQDNSGSHDIAPATSVRGAVQTIIIADAVMGVDNVLAVGGAAQGSMLLVLVGLAVSVPIVVWGSTLVLHWVERFPAIIWLGAGVLGWTAVKMIVTEPLLAPWLCRQSVGASNAADRHRGRTRRRSALAFAVAATTARSSSCRSSRYPGSWPSAGSSSATACISISSRYGTGTTTSSTSCAGQAGFRRPCGCVVACSRALRPASAWRQTRLATTQVADQRSACRKSAIRSSPSSMPTEMRISESAIPIAARRSAPIS